MDKEGIFSFQTGNTAEFQRRLLEKSLAMRAEAYQSQIKAKLLTQAIMQIEHSKKNLQTLNDNLANEIAARKLVEEKIRYIANHDELTGLPNRVLFIDRLEIARKLALRNKKKLAIFFVDLDGFKIINDSLAIKPVIWFYRKSHGVCRRLFVNPIPSHVWVATNLSFC